MVPDMNSTMNEKKKKSILVQNTPFCLLSCLRKYWLNALMGMKNPSALLLVTIVSAKGRESALVKYSFNPTQGAVDLGRLLCSSQDITFLRCFAWTTHMSRVPILGCWRKGTFPTIKKQRRWRNAMIFLHDIKSNCCHIEEDTCVFHGLFLLMSKVSVDLHWLCFPNGLGMELSLHEENWIFSTLESLRWNSEWVLILVL